MSNKIKVTLSAAALEVNAGESVELAASIRLDIISERIREILYQLDVP